LGKLAEYQARRDVRRALVGRERRHGEAAPGRFRRADVDRVLQCAAENFAEGLRGASLPRGWGARRNVIAGIWSLALFRALKREVGDGRYATELATDAIWLSYKRSSDALRVFCRLLARSPRRRMHLFVRAGLRFPFGRPGYEWTARRAGDALETDFHRCPVWDYFRAQDEEAREFFRRSWCTLDYPLAEILADGGRYERAHTLSAGDEVCDMRWIAPERPALPR
jgi:hypothetical protein